jgi:glycerophosphoryl diester phosphodiesterase
MKLAWATALAGLLLTMLPRGAAQSPSSPVPLTRAHAHNDYEHPRPLLDALEQGFCSVEADVWLVEGRLLVSHNLADAQPQRTLEALYLRPLQERAERQGGRVFPGGPSVTLLIDVKSEATNTWLALRDVLQRHEKLFTRFHADRTETNAVTVIVSGNRARELMLADTNRLAGYDGRLDDLETPSSPHFIPLISDNWLKQFEWKARAGDGPMPAAERHKLISLVQRAHGQGRRLRLWAAPDNARAWAELQSTGVDLINTDDLAGLAKFLRRP